MLVAKITGTLISSAKVSSLEGKTLLLVEPLQADYEVNFQLRTTGQTMVVVDSLGAGIGDYVILSEGNSVNLLPELKNCPVDAAVVGILDRVQFEHEAIYRAVSSKTSSLRFSSLVEHSEVEEAN
ncbi:MAG: EutN/CcmL family microcompartment protein [Pirellulaceae bacterium]|nr:EutN/CcmL family microcompartment protein [Pirellulaceae bacterium]